MTNHHNAKASNYSVTEVLKPKLIYPNPKTFYYNYFRNKIYHTEGELHVSRAMDVPSFL